MKKSNAILTGILITLALLIYGESFGQKSNGVTVPSIREESELQGSDRATLIIANNDNSTHVINENIYMVIGKRYIRGNDDWWNGVKFEVQREGTIATRSGMHADWGNLRLVADYDGNNSDENIIFGFNSNVPGQENERMRLTNDGKLGLGVINPNEELDMNGRIRLRGDQGGIWISTGDNNNWTDSWLIGKAVGDGNDYLRLFHRNDGNHGPEDGSASVGGDPFDKFIFTPSGSMGIAKYPNEAYKLHVFGSTYLEGGLKLKNALDIDGDAALKGASSLALYAGGLKGMTITSGGNVAIGKDAATAPLDVHGAIKGKNWMSNEAGLASDFDNNQVGLYKQSVGALSLVTKQSDRVVIDQYGRMTIKAINDGELPNGQTGTELTIIGEVNATSYVSSSNSFPDYVFAPEYDIRPLSEVETYVNTHRHLPNMPSEKEVIENGLDIPEVLTKSVENIEEIYLHLIELEKRVKTLEAENQKLKSQLNK